MYVDEDFRSTRTTSGDRLEDTNPNHPPFDKAFAFGIKFGFYFQNLKGGCGAHSHHQRFDAIFRYGRKRVVV